MEELLQVAQIRFDHAQGMMMRIGRHEASVRRALHDIDEAFRTSTRAPAEQMMSMQKIGAQHIWAKWTQQKRANLNQQLAILLAQKGEAQRVLQKALGQREALEKLLEQSKKAARTKAETKEAEALFTLSLSNKP